MARTDPRKPRKMRNRLLALIVLLAAAGLALMLFRTGAPPVIRIEPAMPGIGKRTPVTVTVEEPGRGLGKVRVEVLQADRSHLLAERDHTPRPFWDFWGPRATTETLPVEVGRETIDDLREGEATIRVTAERASTWLRHPEPVVKAITLPVRLVPPSLEVLSTAVHVSQGGCEAVVYRAGPSAVKDGVRAGKWWFPGFPLPGGGERDRFALFAVPYDLDDASGVKLVARDDVGNEAAASFITRFFPKSIHKDTIRVDDSFMQRVVPAILSRTPGLEDRGDLLQNYLEINGDLRGQNAAMLVELAGRSRPAFLWSRPFLQMPNSKVMSSFADRRTYLYDGKVVDHQDHLGFDLASTRRAPVPAANDGVVVLARFFGIYGNAVVIDHGYGLMTLYGHLSSIDVAEGQEVARGDTLGRTGETGLAGGDHLHFSVLLQGLPVNPVEWWDGHWLHDRLATKLGPGSGLAFQHS